MLQAFRDVTSLISMSDIYFTFIPLKRYNKIKVGMLFCAGVQRSAFPF